MHARAHACPPCSRLHHIVGRYSGHCRLRSQPACVHPVGWLAPPGRHHHSCCWCCCQWLPTRRCITQASTSPLAVAPAAAAARATLEVLLLPPRPAARMGGCWAGAPPWWSGWFLGCSGAVQRPLGAARHLLGPAAAAAAVVAVVATEARLCASPDSQRSSSARIILCQDHPLPGSSDGCCAAGHGLPRRPSVDVHTTTPAPRDAPTSCDYRTGPGIAQRRSGPP